VDHLIIVPIILALNAFGTRRTGEGIYPRFGEASKRFFEAWERLRSFCEREQFSLPVMNQLELTYINHIPIAQNVDPFKEANIVFPDMRKQ
jgi:hypothetical protein